MVAVAGGAAVLLAVVVAMVEAQGGIFDDQDFDRWQPPPALFLGHGQDGTCHIARRRGPCKVRHHPLWAPGKHKIQSHKFVV